MKRVSFIRFIRGVALASACGLISTAAISAPAKWVLDAPKSSISFVAVKNINTAETFNFTQLQASVSNNGETVLSVPLSSISTGVDIRNSRMQALLFETHYLPNLHLTATLPPTLLDSLAPGSSVIQPLTTTLTLHGIRKEITLDTLIIKQAADKVSITPRKPIIINSADFDMNGGVEALRAIASLITISEKVPVYFRLHLTTNATGTESLTLPSPPPSPLGLVGSISTATKTAALVWTDTSTTETGFLVRRRGADGRWGTLTKTNANTVTYSDVLQTPGSFDYKLIAVTESIPSVATAPVSLTLGAPSSSSTSQVTASSSSARSSTAATSSSAGSGDATRGKSLFASMGCASCHGNDGTGIYKLNPAKATYSYKNNGKQQDLASYINDWMPEGSPSECTGQCALDIAAYLRTWNTASSGASSSTTTGTSLPLSHQSALRKVKNILTGLAPTEQELARPQTPQELQLLIDSWMQTPEFKEKMLFFFANVFQQSSISIPDFYNQLRNRPGAFNLAYGIYGDTALPQLFKNMNESFARTAVHFAETGRPLSDLLTTDEIMMTTALKSLYMQIEANWDTASNPNVMKWKFNYGRRPALADSLNPNSPDYMVFGHEAPASVTAERSFSDNCNGNTSLVAQYPGNVYLFHLLLGHVGRDRGAGPGMTNTGCWERATKPYFTASDLSDWKLVKVVKGTRIEPWDLIKLRASGNSLPSSAPRISFFTTPAFMAVWNTNDSNSHRVTVNQALLSALGMGFTSASQSIPIPPNTAAVDGNHAVNTTECFACHKSLDPMRQFFDNWYLPTDKPKGGTGTGPQPSFGFANVTGNGRTLVDFGNFIKQVTDEAVTGDVINRFALEMTQKLCYFANSAKCEETDPEMRRIAREFERGGFNFKQLVSNMYSSPLVTAKTATATADKNGVNISILRRDQLCQALSNRLGVTDICKIALPLRANLSRLGLLAGALPYDTFSRGVAEPVTPSDPNIFYRGASELLCEAVAAQVVDNNTNRIFSSADPEGALLVMTTKVMALPPNDPKHASALSILRTHYNNAVSRGATKTNALRSTFSAACQAPSSLGVGI
jgi:polyisoprenoid-binding protein YceI/cytochrome c553